MKNIVATKEMISFTIFAVQPHAPEEVMLFMTEHDIPFKVMLGSWQGKQEVSFCVPEVFLPLIVDAGFIEEQESILTLAPLDSKAPFRMASIEYRDGRPVEEAGLFTPMPKADALKQSGWTFDPGTQTFFVIRPAADIAVPSITSIETH